MIDPATPLVQARGIGIAFPGVRAVAAVDFDLLPGEVHAIVGENGAGKSTLGKLLCGELQGDEGELTVEGRTRHFASPRDGLAAGVAMIPQELQLVASLSVAENIFLGHEPRLAGGMVDRRGLADRARPWLEQVGAGHVAPLSPLASLSPGDRQLVAIARALSLEARCLIMDEPTAALGAEEEARLEQLIRTLTARGTGVVYVSHKLDHVLALAHRVTVMRDGQRVTTRPAQELTAPELVRLMVGRDVPPSTLAPVPPAAREVLRIEGLGVTDPGRAGEHRLHDVSLSVRAGEIVGLAGLVGAGRSDLLLSLVGAHPGRVTGAITLDGQRFHPASPADARDAGLVLLPEERKQDGLFPRLGVDRNITTPSLRRVSRRSFVNVAAEQRAAADLMARLGVRAAHPDLPIAALSGGNQQKALLARSLFASPTVLLLDEPTRGVDLAARAEIYRELHELAAQGYGILLASSDLTEILTQCHRILVVRDGTIVAEFDRGEASEERVLAAAAGSAGERATDALRRQQSPLHQALRPASGIASATVSSSVSSSASPSASPFASPSSLASASTSASPSESSPASLPDASQGESPNSPPASPPASIALVARRLTAWLARVPAAVGLFAVLLLAVVTSPRRGGSLIFLDLGNLTDILRQVSEKGILAVGMTAVVIAGGIDLSVGSLLAFGATLSALLLMHGGLGLAATALVVVAAGAAWGVVNALVVARWRLPAFIATLATMSAARGAARLLSGGTAIPLGFGEGGAPDAVRALAAPLVPYLPVPALIFGATVLAMHVYLERTRSGRYVFAIGDNESAARLSGVRVGFHRGVVYVAAGALAALAGLVHCAQLEQGNPNDGVAYELDAIAAVVIGGTPLRGGTGSVGGTVIGILIIGIINNSMGLNNVDANLQLILKGAIILLAVWLQRRRD